VRVHPSESSGSLNKVFINGRWFSCITHELWKIFKEIRTTGMSISQDDKTQICFGWDLCVLRMSLVFRLGLWRLHFKAHNVFARSYSRPAWVC